MGTAGQVRLGFPGDDHSFSEAAGREYFKFPHVKTGLVRPVKLVPLQVFEKTVEKFHSGHVDEIIVPIRNNNSRSVEGMQKLLTGVHGWVAGEYYLHVEQCCLVNPGVTIEKLTNMWTMGPAKDQTNNFLFGRKLNWVSKPDTAMAARDLKKSGRFDTCAIASPQAGEFYKLENLGNVCNFPYNFTHFLHIVKKDRIDSFTPDASQQCITKIVLYGELYPESGRSPLDVFSSNSVKVTNPIDAGKGTFQHTTTILDLSGHRRSAAIRACLDEITKMKYFDGDDGQTKPYRFTVMGCFLHRPPPSRDQVIYKTPILDWQ